MAVMYPSELPEQVRLDPARRAEAFVYDRLATLPEAYHVFYSVKWQANSRRGIPRDGEADFVLAHPALGVLVLEVKGGAVEYHGYQERWVSVDSRGRPRRGAADPVEQARESCHALLGIFCAQPDWDHRWLRCGYALAFPDIRLNDGQRLPPCSPAPLLLDATAFDALQPAIERAFGHWKGEDDPGALGEDRLAVVQALLDGWVVLPEAWSHQAIEARLLQLTEQQLFVLDLLRCQRRALIAGCAGSGKTLLAREQARRLAAGGARVLLTCFNKPLGQWLAAGAPPGVLATNFHDLCYDLAAESGAPCLPDGPADQRYFDEQLPEALVRAARHLGRRFDALVIDEAQDFSDGHWLALSELLAPDGQAFVFFDSHQNLYAKGQAAERFGLLVPGAPLMLSRNCRTTRTIHQVATAFGDGQADSAAPAGPPVCLVTYAGRREHVRAVRQQLHRLVSTEGVPPGEIALLTGHKLDADSPFAAGQVLGNLTLTTTAPPGPNEVLVSTIQRFKGLERRAVILADLDQTVHPDLPTVLYVGASRAKEHLAVVIDQAAPPAILARLQTAATPAPSPTPEGR